MLLIVAPHNDAAAWWLADRWKSRSAVLLHARDLSQTGWEFAVPPRGPSPFMAGGRAHTTADLTGVVTRLSGVVGNELEHIALEDRSYVSAEMSAFLLAWLSRLSCPILNRPTPGCLCGPNWRIEKWIHLAASLGIPVEPVRRSTLVPVSCEENDGTSVTVVGNCCVGAVHASLAGFARRLAAAADVELLEVRFTSAGTNARLQSVSLSPDISQPEIADAMLAYFDSRARGQ